jgi:hypothetical protein
VLKEEAVAVREFAVRYSFWNLWLPPLGGRRLSLRKKNRVSGPALGSMG